MSNKKIAVAIIGSGNIGSDLMYKILRQSQHQELTAMVGIDPNSEGLKRAQQRDVKAIDTGIDGLVQSPQFKNIKIAYDATSAGAHHKHNEVLQAHGVRVVDLTPAAIGPYLIPPVNSDAHIGAPNINMVTCGGQATIPMAVSYTHLTLPTILRSCRSRWSPYH